MRSVLKLKERAYDAAVARTLNFYESWVLPCPKEGGFLKQKRISLREAKLREFREKKQLLNPYEKISMLESASQEERLRLEEVSKRTNFYSIRNFKLSYNRHKDAYGYRVQNFPDSYKDRQSIMDYRNDPD